MRAELHIEKGRPDKNRLVVDGVDLTRHVVARTLRVDIEPGVNGEAMAAKLHIDLVPNELDLTGDLQVAIATITTEED